MLFSLQVKYWLEQLAGELNERLTRESELVNFLTVSFPIKRLTFVRFLKVESMRNGQNIEV